MTRLARFARRVRSARDRIGVAAGVAAASVGVALEFSVGWALIVAGAAAVAYSLVVVEVGGDR